MALLTRTDEQRAERAPIVLTFGGESREVRPLPLRRSRDWKKSLNTTLGQLSGIQIDFADEQTGKLSMEAIQKTVESIAVAVPDLLADLVFQYLKLADPSVAREWFDDTATDQDVTDALLRLIEVTFPFLWKLGDLTKLGGKM